MGYITNIILRMQAKKTQVLRYSIFSILSRQKKEMESTFV